MALDNAQFISELSIVDPPGTDAVAEGDDHIRTVKRATQQSFPNVDAAVPQTAAQMGQMAIKNEVNVFTQINTFAPDQLFTEAIHVRKQANNNIADIRYQDAAGINRWIVRFDADTLDDAYKIQRRDSLGAFLDDPISVSGATGAITFANTVDFQGKPTVTAGSIAIRQGTVGGVVDIQYQEIASGFTQWIVRRSSDATGNNYQILRRDATGGSVDTPFQIDFATGELLISNAIRQINGTIALPSYSFTSDPDTGMFRFGSNSLGFSTAGVTRATVTNAGIRSNIAGTAGAPSYSFNDDADTGIFALLGNQFAFTAGGVERMRIKFATVNMTLPTTNAGLSSGDCFISSGFVAIVP